MSFKQNTEEIINMLGSFFKNIFNKIKESIMKIKIPDKRIIVIIAVFVVVSTAIGAGYYYYFQIFKSPNFEDGSSNNVVTYSMKNVSPGDTLSYEVNYKNTGYRDVDILNIIIPIPDNTEPVSFTEGGDFDEKDSFEDSDES